MVANVLRYIAASDSEHHLICQGVQRFRITELPRWLALPGGPRPAPARTHRRRAGGRGAVPQSARAGAGDPGADPAGAGRSCARPSPASPAPGRWPTWPRPISTSRRRRSRRSWRPSDLIARLDKIIAPDGPPAAGAASVATRSARQTQAALSERQRQALLREQLATIQRELGEDEGGGAEIAELAAAIDKAGMPEEVEAQARKELRRLQRTPEAAAEYGMIRAYLDWLIELPWAAPEPPAIDIAEARRILDEDHYGLEKIKTRILEYLAVRKLAPEGKAPILCFVGPPGVGKTSLGQSIARAMGRQVRARQPRRRPRRGRDPRPPAHLYRRAARQHHPGDPQGRRARLRDDAGRDRQDGRRASTAIRPRPCSRCWTRNRTAPSATTIWRSRSTCRGWCSSPPPTCWTPSPGPCATAWRSSPCPAIRRARSCRSPSAIWSAASSRPTG